MLEQEFQYYLDHQSELLKKYQGKFLIIKNNEVVDFADTFEAVLRCSQSLELEPGTFLIQECTPGEDSYTQTFHSRVIFA